jgi:hypothetical protein
MRTLGEAAKLLRSKNAGIGAITVDIVCPDATTYEAVKMVLTRERVATVYAVPVERVAAVIPFDAGWAIKIALQRPRIAGGEGLGETDLYGSAQYAPLLDLPID